MALDYTDFFTKLGRAAFAANTANAAVGATVEDEVEDYVQQYGASDPIEVRQAADGILDVLRDFQAGASNLNSSLAASVRALLVQRVIADNPQLDQDEQTALDELVRQMQADGQSVDASAVSVTITAASGNTGNGVVVFSHRRPDGLVNEHAYGEDLTLICTLAGPGASFSLTGEESQSDKLAYDWPQGSGADISLTALNALSDGNLATNGRFTDSDDESDHLPDGWIAPVATLGTTLKMSSVEVQTVVISGTPSSGWYTLTFTDANGDPHTTGLLAYNASESDIQTAIQALPTLGEVTVSTTGTSPNYTHAITFTDVPNPAQLTSTNGLNTGSIAHNTTTAGSAHALKGSRVVEFDSNGSQLTTIQTPIAVASQAQYAVNLFAKVDSVPAAGVLTVDLVDGVGGTVIRDDEGFQNTVQFSATALTTSQQSLDALVTGANEVQALTITGTPTGGTFTITYDGQTTAAIAYNAAASAVKTALEALSNIGTGNVACGGGSLPGTPVTITFQNAMGKRDVPLATADGSGLTGGISPAAAIALTTQGNPDYAVFRTPLVLPNQVYLRIRISTAVSNTSSVFFNEVVLAEMTQAYAGGVYLAVFDGPTDYAPGDRVTVAVTNDRAGAIHEFANRIWSLGDNERLLPSNSAGAETISDSLIS